VRQKRLHDQFMVWPVVEVLGVVSPLGDKDFLLFVQCSLSLLVWVKISTVVS
jgi:hypothetical protein